MPRRPRRSRAGPLCRLLALALALALARAEPPPAPPACSPAVVRSIAWGAGIGAHQAEGAAAAIAGARAPSVWEAYIAKNLGAIADGSSAAAGADFAARFKSDVALLKSLGVKHFRLSLSWPRLLPGARAGSAPSAKAVAFYNDLLDELLAAGIQPMVALYHCEQCGGGGRCGSWCGGAPPASCWPCWCWLPVALPSRAAAAAELAARLPRDRPPLAASSPLALPPPSLPPHPPALPTHYAAVALPRQGTCRRRCRRRTAALRGLRSPTTSRTLPTRVREEAAAALSLSSPPPLRLHTAARVYCRLLLLHADTAPNSPKPQPQALSSQPPNSSPQITANRPPKSP